MITQAPSDYRLCIFLVVKAEQSEVTNQRNIPQANMTEVQADMSCSKWVHPYTKLLKKDNPETSKMRAVLKYYSCLFGRVICTLKQQSIPYKFKGSLESLHRGHVRINLKYKYV